MALARFIEGTAFGVLNDILSTFHSEDGYATPNRFEVLITRPGGHASESREVSMRCESINLPGRNLNTLTDTNIYGPTREVVDGVTYADEITMTFQASSGLEERVFFEEWQTLAFDEETWNVGYYDDYAKGAKIHIFQLGSDNMVDVPTYGIEAVEVYPATIAAIDYNYANSNQLTKITVAFNYKEWHNLAEDNVVGMEYGKTKQTLHDIKSIDRGLFGKLPPEIQRAGRDIANIAKTQLPIGRLTQGKIFPPFT